MNKLINNSAYGKSVKEKMSFWHEINIFKLMNNSIYGKRINARLINNVKKFKLYKNEFLE